MGGVSRRRFIASVVAVASGIASIYGLYEYPGLKPYQPRREGSIKSLVNHRMTSGMSVDEAINKRRSVREYEETPLTYEELSSLLWAAQGKTDASYGFRAAPSAGATYPLELYSVVGEGGVKGLDAGVYHYNVDSHELSLHLKGDLRRELYAAALKQGWVLNAPVDLVIAAVYPRTTRRYGDRGVRYVHMEVGHVGENIYLRATSLGLGTVAVGAFYDEGVREALNLPRGWDPLYIMPVGRLKQ